MTDKLKFLFDHDIFPDSSRTGPYSVEIDPTNHCPIGCSFCIWSDMRQKDLTSLKEDVFSKLIDDLIDLRVSGIVFTGGGEPLRHPFTRKAIVKAKKGGINVGLFTSGVPLVQNVCEEILPHLSWIRFNLSAADSESYLKIQGVDKFQHVVDNISNAVRMKNEKGLRVKLVIGCILSRLESDINTVGDLTELATRLGVDVIQFKHDLNEIGTTEYEEWWDFIVLPKLRSITQNYSSKITVEYSEHTYAKLPKEPCFIVSKMAAIKADGSVVLCKLHRDSDSMAVGNVNINSFRDIWLGAHRPKIIGALEKEGCDNCCGYKDFNRHVQITRGSELSSPVNGIIPSYLKGIQLYGDDIHFL